MKVDCIYKYFQKDEFQYLETTPNFPKEGYEFSNQMNNLYFVRGDGKLTIYNRDGTYSMKVKSSVNSEDVSLSEKINAKGTWECDGNDNYKLTWINEDGNPVTWYSKDGSKKVGKPEDIKKPEVKEKPKGSEEVNKGKTNSERKSNQPVSPETTKGINFEYKYPNDKTYIYGVKGSDWYAKNTKNGKVFNISKLGYQTSVDKLNKKFPNAFNKPDKGDENVDNTEKEVNVNVNSMSRKTPQPPNVKTKPKSPNTGGILKNNPKGGDNSNLKDNYSKSDNSVYVNPKDL